MSMQDHMIVMDKQPTAYQHTLSSQIALNSDVGMSRYVDTSFTTQTAEIMGKH